MFVVEPEEAVETVVDTGTVVETVLRQHMDMNSMVEES